MHLTNILGLQQQAAPFGLTDVAKIRNTLGKITQNAGFKNAEEFWNDPGPNGPQPPPPPEIQVANITAQAQQTIEQMRGQAELQLTSQQSNIKHGADMQIAAAKAESEMQIAAANQRHEQQLSATTQQHEQHLERMRLEFQSQMAESQNQNRLVIAEMGEETKRMIASQQVNLKLNQGLVQPPTPLPPPPRDTGLQDLAMSIGQLAKAHGMPKQIIRGQDGRAVGLGPMNG